MRKKKMKTKENKKGALPIFIGLIILLVGYLIGCAFPADIFLPGEQPVTGVDDDLNKGIGNTDRAINLTGQKQYDEARALLNESEKLSRKVGEYIEPYEVEKKYLDNLIPCMNNLIYVIEISETDNITRTIEYINRFLADFSNLENICAEITEKYAGIAERLNIEETMVNLKPVKYDMMDFKEEYNKNKTVPPASISPVCYPRKFRWKDHSGKEQKLNIGISDRRYGKYGDMSHDIYGKENFQKYIYSNDTQIREIAKWFNATYTDPEDRANGILSFVQSCISYEPEEKQYLRYPIETIIEGGDCEDKTILFVSIMKAAGYNDVAFIYFKEEHVMGGVALKDGLRRTKGPLYFPKRGTPRYYVCDTTGSRMIGSAAQVYYKPAFVIPVE